MLVGKVSMKSLWTKIGARFELLRVIVRVVVPVEPMAELGEKLLAMVGAFGSTGQPPRSVRPLRDATEVVMPVVEFNEYTPGAPVVGPVPLLIKKVPVVGSTTRPLALPDHWVVPFDLRGTGDVRFPVDRLSFHKKGPLASPDPAGTAVVSAITYA
ncbi:hypothetical protein MF271_00460 (plasmid) [Deinococcus sp. KNUC1210]|uniref:hypothetical protein n=1 Tax=Deinococcus sp. KNUC1210 TaxID=2917691 RepID=UPI001EF02CE5|nr:hypothetical protein [Deinococcus sp. KNUC1210]ULH13862.1 hypothetical protein MF271_00460 [Deinococcus sp. KNUC1210]